MIYQDTTTYYISSSKNPHLVKYELIRMQDDDYLVKVFDEQTKGIAEPKHIVQIDEFKIAHASYQQEQNDSSQSYEMHVQACCQDHRNKLD